MAGETLEEGQILHNSITNNNGGGIVANAGVDNSSNNHVDVQTRGNSLENNAGFGMWKDRADLADPELYVLHLREEGKHATGEPKTPEEYLAELKAWDE